MRVLRTGLSVTAPVILALVAGAFAAHADEESLQKRLTALRLPTGWKYKEDPASYDAKNLFELIDGEAELYFPYGFKRTLSLSYVATANPTSSVAVEVYEMGSTLDAFGIYSNYRDAHSTLTNIGTEGFFGGSQLMFYQARYFVKARMTNAALVNPKALMECARAISRILPSNTAPPEELALISIKHVIPQSRQYFAQSLLGYDFFSMGLTADAIVGTERTRVFVVLEITPKTAAEALGRYEAYLTENRAAHRWRKMADGRVFVARDPLHKNVLVRQIENCLIGVANLSSADQGYSLLQQLDAAVRKNTKPATPKPTQRSAP